MYKLYMTIREVVLIVLALIGLVSIMSSCTTSHKPYNKHVVKVQKHKKPACYRVTGYTRIF